PSPTARRASASPRKAATLAKPAAKGKATGSATQAKPAAAGKPAPRRAPRPRRADIDLDRLSALITASLEDDKAEDIVTLDLAGRAAFAERMIIATGLADRQIEAMAAHLAEKLRAAGLKRVPVEGAGGADWVLLDAGDIIVHLFKPDARRLYNLEKMWGSDLDGPEVSLVP
ncbi:MAG: ribosome silencing factor, partial [Acidibrevibacterium sp.]|uniref:ribosome silencing factor n=1 Tax=Acidibrevibacterium sp. TaxID=2606776 RepID=UPI003CFDF7CA